MSDSKKEIHPSFGLLSFNRTHGGEKSLFGSSILHNETIVMRLRSASVERSLHSDFYMDTGLIAEVEMSPSQFAEAITSLNIGVGVPVTLRWLKHEGDIETCPFTGKQQQFEEEFKANIEQANSEANELLNRITDLLEKKSNLTKSDKFEIQKIAEKLSSTINNNRTFIYQQFNEQMEKTVTDAKSEIENFMQNKMLSVANKALVENHEDVIPDITVRDRPIEIDTNHKTKGDKD